MPAAGTALPAGASQVLKAEFKPSDTKNFTSISKTVKINVMHPGKSSVVFNTTKTYGSMVDQEGYIYKTIQIGTQTWMAENLRVTKYRNGDPIFLIADNTAWTTTTSGAYSNSLTPNDDYTATYGRYYNAYAVTDSRNIAPVGWHVPTNTEWAALVTYLGGQYSAGGKLKETGSTHWLGGNAGATNSTGFSGVPGGYRSYVNGAYQSIGSYGYFWTQTAFDASRMYAENLLYYGSGSELVYYRNNVGHSVRLIKD